MLSLKQVFLEAQSNHQAIPAFNIDSFEIYQAIESVVAQIKYPCIVQLSLGEDEFIQAEKLFLLVKKAQLEDLPIYLNMDHQHNLSRLEKLVQFGFDMVHFDGSDLEYSTNLKTTTDFIAKIKLKYPNVLIEAEFNKINPTGSQLSSQNFTNPDTAFEFISQTKADLLAVSIGNLHGSDPTSPENLDLNLLSNIQKKLPQQFFTLHGGSGISQENISGAIKLGIVKVNINTDLRHQFFKSLKTNLDIQQSDKVYELFHPVIEDLKIIIKDKFLCMM